MPWRRIEDYTDNRPEVVLWDENWDVFHLYLKYARQWRCGAAGPIGLDMTVFHHALDRKGIKGDEYDEFVDLLSVIESAALEVWNEEE